MRAWRIVSFWLVGILCLGALEFGTAAARAASFTASLDRDTIALGEQATLSLTFEGGQAKNVPTPSAPGLQISQIGTSQSVNIVNTEMRTTVTVTFSVTPQHDGKFTIPAMTAEVSGQTLTSQPLTLTVQKVAGPSVAAIQSGNEVAFMKLLLPLKRVYVGQVLTAQLQIYLRDDVQNFGNFQFITRPAEGFIIGKSAQGGRYRTQIGNRVYAVIPVSLALSVLKAGDLELGPFTASMIVVLPAQNRNGDWPFNVFNPGEQKQVSLATDAIDVQSLPLPAEGRPADFNGAIGHFTMTATAGPTNVAVGDPITMRIQIAGRGALDSLTLPEQPAWQNFKVYPPTSKLETSDQLGLEGTRTFEEIVSPENTDVHQLPQFAFSFFDPEDGNYHTLAQPPDQAAVRLESRISRSRVGAGLSRIACERAWDIERTEEILREASRIPQRCGRLAATTGGSIALTSSGRTESQLSVTEEAPLACGERARYSGSPTRKASCWGGVALRTSSQNLSLWPN